MLNRLFIVVGMLAIVALLAAFIVPRFIQWGDYRGRMEEAATAALGAPVKITGDIQFQLLPQPELNFAGVVVGPPDHPAARVAHVQAQFSLIDFIRDQYTVTKLVLQQPQFDAAIGSDGAFDVGIALTETPTGSNVAIQSADIVGGGVTIKDARSGGELALSDVSGELKISAVRGPFAFQGKGTSGGQGYDLRLTTSLISDDGKTQVSLFTRPVDEAWSVSAAGTLTLGTSPTFAGDLTYRQAPPATETDQTRGDLVLEGKVEASAAKVLLTSYTVMPDENRMATRLTGAAEVTLDGPAPKFKAVISGGVVALPPRDATAEAAVEPYELVRLLAELPVPPLPTIAGTINVDIAEVNLRAVSLRNVRFDATSDDSGWELRNFAALLPGNTALTVGGRIAPVDGHIEFAGNLGLKTSRLDLLAQLWRKPVAANPLFNVPASFSANVSLNGDTLQIAQGSLLIEGIGHALDVSLGFGQTRRIDATATLATMDARQSGQLAALLPDFVADPGFGVTFPRGHLDLAATEATVFGLDGKGLALSAGWEGGVLDLQTVAADDFGGAAFRFGATAFGTFVHPEMSGEGSIKVASATAPALDWVFSRLNTPQPMQDFLRRAMPAEVAFSLDPPAGDGSQTLAVKGIAGVAQLDAKVNFSAGMPRAIGKPLGLTADLTSDDPAALGAQIGLGSVDLLPPGAPMHVGLVLQGNPVNSLETSLVLEGGGDSLGFAGHLVVLDPTQWTGKGTLKVALSDPSPLVELLGAQGIVLPAVAGSAELSFAGAETLALSEIDARAGGQPVTGALRIAQQTGHRAIAGDLAVGAIPFTGVVAALVGPAGLIGTPGQIWPGGPIDLGGTARDTTGRVRITTPAVTSGNATLLSDASFDLDWDATALLLRGLEATVGGGTIALDAAICCSGPLPQKTLTGRVVVTGADLKALLPAGAAAGLGGKIDLNAQVEGNGDSLAAIAGTLVGEGSFAINGLEVARFDPGAFAAVGALDNIVDLAPDQFAGIIGQALEQGPFAAPAVSGSFALAGGSLRSANLAVETDTVRLHGSGTIRLADLSLDGTYTMTPKGTIGTSGLISEATSQVVSHVTGTVLAPRRTFDVAAMVDAVQVKAYEIELAELERLRAEDEARAKAAAEERARLAAEKAEAYAQAAITAVAELPVVGEELARIAAGDAARRAAEAELKRLMTPAPIPQPVRPAQNTTPTPAATTTTGPLQLFPAAQ